jgi:hypothetical protein
VRSGTDGMRGRRLTRHAMMRADGLRVRSDRLLAMTADERKVAEVLINCGPTNDARGGPIQEVGMAMPGWDTATAKSFVEDMLDRGLVQIKSKAKEHYDLGDRQESWWELGDAE